MWEGRRSHPQLQGRAPPSTQSYRDRGKLQQPPRGPDDSVQAAKSSSQTANGHKKESSHETGDGHVTGGGSRRQASRQPVDQERKHRESASVPVGPGSGQKTSTGSDETAHGQKGSMTSRGESAFVHAAANGPWNESATPEISHAPLETESRHSDTPRAERDDPTTPSPGREEAAELPVPAEAKPPPPPPPHTNRGRKDLARTHTTDTLHLPLAVTPLRRRGE